MELALNNRELATVIWLCIGLGWAMTKPDIRSALWGVVCAFVQWKHLATVAVLLAYIGVLIALASRVELWDADLVNDTVLWVVTAALVLLVNSHQIAEEHGALWRVARQAVGFTVLVEAFANLFVLPLVVELVLLPVAAFLSMALVVAESDDEYAPAERVFNAALVVLGSLILAFVVAQLSGLGNPDWAHVWRALGLPFWLTLGTLPMIYVLGLLAEGERQMLRRRLRRAV